MIRRQEAPNVPWQARNWGSDELVCSLTLALLGVALLASL